MMPITPGMSMMKEKTVMIVTPDKKLSKQINGSLLAIGYRAVGECKDGAGALRLARMILPRLIVIDDDLIDQKGIAVGKILAQEGICPVIVVSNKWYYDAEPSAEEGLLAVISKPLQQDMLQQFATCLGMADSMIKSLERDLGKLRTDLENRKFIERAKGILMAREQLSEEEAYQFLRRSSMDKMVSLAALAKEIVAQKETKPILPKP